MYRGRTMWSLRRSIYGSCIGKLFLIYWVKTHLSRSMYDNVDSTTAVWSGFVSHRELSRALGYILQIGATLFMSFLIDLESHFPRLLSSVAPPPRPCSRRQRALTFLARNGMDPLWQLPMAGNVVR